MKQLWTPQELIDHWTLTAEELALVHTISQTSYNQLGYALMFKCFQREGKFPQRKQDIPPVIVEHSRSARENTSSHVMGLFFTTFYHWQLIVLFSKELRLI